jgi:acyl-CoA synthetase (AMP-forming)/AMP-acid ligase II
MEPHNRPAEIETQNPATLAHVLRMWARTRPDSRAYVFIDEHGDERSFLTFGELDRRACLIAASLLRHARSGERALLVFEPGLELLVAFFGCLYAGVIAVPVPAPRRNKLRESTASIFRNCAPVFALTTSRIRDVVMEAFASVPMSGRLRWIAVDELAEDVGEDPGGGPPDFPRVPDADALAFLQYTSGSTSAPKGVMVSHRNLLENLGMIVAAMETTRRSDFVSWVPLYHDMGLILNTLHTMYLGSCCVLMAPGSFLQRPLAWLRAIDKYRAEVAGAPNFAYDLCVSRFDAATVQGLDLSGWKVAFNAAEPIRAETLRRFADAFRPFGFRESAFYMCYGMAEATVFMSGGRRGCAPVIRRVHKGELRERRISAPASDPASQEVVSCGYPTRGERLVIVDPERAVPCAAGRIGEIWARGPHVARGYWENREATQATFGARLAGEAAQAFLRTGDLGFIEDEQLYFTGRLKDTIIIRGSNYYPQDIELLVERSHPALRATCGAAFTVPHADAEALVVVQEVERTYRHRLDVAEVVANIRQAVVSELELSVHRVVLIKTGTIPKTSSGKIQRGLTRARYLDGSLEVWGDDHSGAAPACKQLTQPSPG